MRITKLGVDNKQWFKTLATGEVFEYVESVYIKTGVSANEPNAVDLMTGAEDIIGLNAEVEVMNAELTITPKEY